MDRALFILTVSLSANHMLCRWHRKQILTPHMSIARSADIVYSILDHFGVRNRAGSPTTLVKVLNTLVVFVE